MKQYLALLSFFILLIGCTITTPPTTTTTSSTITSTSCVISNLTVNVIGDSATLQWTNPTAKNYNYSEFYLYNTETANGTTPELITSGLLEKSTTSLQFTDLQENKSYLVTIISYTTDGHYDYANEIFTAGTLTTKTERISIAFRPGFLYLSPYIAGPVLEVGETAKILIDKIPTGYTIDDIKWMIKWIDYDDNSGDQYSENSVVTFEEATQTLHAHRLGMGFAIAYIDDTKFSNEIKFDIRDRIEKIKMFGSSKTLSLDPSDDISKTTFKAFYYDKDDNRLFLPFVKDAEWRSSDESVVTINPIIPTNDEGKTVSGTNWAEIIANGIGTATVTLITNGVKFETDVTVQETLTTIETFTFADNTVDLAVGEEYTPNYTVTPANAASQVNLHVYTSSTLVLRELEDSPYFEINNGKITALQSAVGWLRATWYENGKFKVSKPVCLKATVPLTDFTLNVSSVQLNVNETYNLTYSLTPANADVTSDEISYSSDATSIATINNTGKITAVSNGIANITVQIKDKTHTVPVSVCTPVSGITADQDYIVLGLNGTAALTPTVTPNDASDKTVTWSSTSPAVAAVDNNGTVTGKTAGIAEIWASAAQYTARTTVVVIDTTNIEILDANTSVSGLTGYKTDSTGTLSFSQNDAAGKKGSSWVSMTNKIGWKYQLNDKALTFSGEKATADGITVRIKPLLVKENGNQKVMFVIAMTNDRRDVFQRSVKLGAYCSVKPNTGSNVTLTATDYGVQASDETMNMILQVKNGTNEASVSSLRIGNAANAQTLIYNNSTVETFSGTTAGISFSYQGLNFGPGSLKSGCFSIDYSMIEPDPIDVIVY